MPDSCLALWILLTAFLLLFSLMPTQATTLPTETPPRNASLLGGISTNTLPPANCFDNSLFVFQTPLHRLLQSKHCLPLISSLYLADGVLKTRGSNGGPNPNGGTSPNGNTIWEATSETCQALVELNGQVQNKMAGQVWLKILRAFRILYTDCVKTSDSGGQISIHDPSLLDPFATYIAKLRYTSITQRSTHKRDVGLTDSSLTHKNDSQSAKHNQVDGLEYTPAAAKFATLKHVCSRSSPKGYVSHRMNELCHSLCNLATGICDGATTGEYKHTPQHVAETAIDFDGTMQVGKAIATGLHVKRNKDSAHSVASELSSVAKERRDLDLLKLANLKVDGPYCYASPAGTPASFMGCRVDVDKLQFNSTGPVESAPWKLTASDYPTLETKLVRTKSDHCVLNFQGSHMGNSHTLESLMWDSAQKLARKILKRCFSSSDGGGQIFVSDKSTKDVILSIHLELFDSWGTETDEKTSLLGSTYDLETQLMQQGDGPGHKPAPGKLAALKRFCSKDRLGGKISERTKEICHSYCDSTTAACAVATVALYGINHQHAALITAGSAGVLQFGKAISTRLAIPRKENSAHAQAESNDWSNTVTTEDEDPLDKMEKNIKHRRSIDRRRREALIEHSLGGAQEMQVHSVVAHLQRKLSN
jgi:hypothetical protein